MRVFVVVTEDTTFDLRKVLSFPDHSFPCELRAVVGDMQRHIKQPRSRNWSYCRQSIRLRLLVVLIGAAGRQCIEVMFMTKIIMDRGKS